MGLMDFVANAGAALFGGSGESDQERSAKLENHVRLMRLDVKQLKIDVSGETATVSGQASSQADREKVLLAVGNTKGIAKVEDKLSVARSSDRGRIRPAHAPAVVGTATGTLAALTVSRAPHRPRPRRRSGRARPAPPGRGSSVRATPSTLICRGGVLVAQQAISRFVFLDLGEASEGLQEAVVRVVVVGP
jgi:hypothetical protein